MKLPQSALRLTAPSKREPKGCVAPSLRELSSVSETEGASGGTRRRSGRTPANTGERRDEGIPPYVVRPGLLHSAAVVRRRALHSAAALTRTSSISASVFFLSKSNKPVRFGKGGMNFAVILAERSSDEVTCVIHSDAARRLHIRAPGLPLQIKSDNLIWLFPA